MAAHALLFSLLALPLAGELPLPAPAASWTAAEKQAQRVAAQQLAADLNAALDAGAGTFTIPAGDYRFGPEGLASLNLIDRHDAIIDAAGATFWFHGRHRVDALKLSRCRDVTIRGLTIDYDPPAYSQGEIVAKDDAAKTVDIRIDPGYPLPDESWTAQAGKIKAIFYDREGYQIPVRMDWIASLTSLGDAVYRVGFRFGWHVTYRSPVQLGDRLTLPDRSLRHTVNLDACERVTLEDVTIYASPHMALVEGWGPGGNVYRRVKVIRRPGTSRLLACNADVFHSIQNDRGPTIESCEFSHAGDDLVNVHGCFALVAERQAPDRFAILVPEGPNFGVDSRLRFYDYATMEPRGEAVVKACEPVTDEARLAAARAIPVETRAGGKQGIRDVHPRISALFDVRLDQPVAAERLAIVGTGERRGAWTRISGSYFHDGFVRGVLLKAQDALVEGNRFERIGQSAIICSAQKYWLEGPCPERITIRHNTIADCGQMLGARMWAQHNLGAISIASDPGVAVAVGRQNVGFAILGNTITNAPVAGIYLANVHDAEVADNVIDGWGRETLVTPGTVPNLGAEPHAAIFLVDTGEVRLQRNRCLHPGPLSTGEILRGVRAEP